jgi:hypothetical protein
MPAVPQQPSTCSTRSSNFFEDGKYWMKGDFIDDDGAMRCIRTAHNLYRAPTPRHSNQIGSS